jgi:DegV family protein with EDD domain
MPVKIVTDSTASLPTDVASELAIEVVPLIVRFGTREYVEGVDLSTEEFYDLLETSPDHPATSQPSPAAFREVYESLGSQGDDIVSIHISGKLSGTLASAQQAANELPDQKILTLDSGLASMALGLVVVEIARMAAAGADADSLAASAEELARRAHCVFVVPTLEYLRRGGRIGGAQAFVGSLLNLKPVLALRDGEVAPVARARSLRKALGTVVDQVRLHAPNGVESLAILHTYDLELRQDLEDQLLAVAPPSGDLYGDIPIGPVIGAHIGRGAVAVGFIAAG